MDGREIWHKIRITGDEDGDYTEKYPALSGLLWLNSIPTQEYISTFGKHQPVFSEEFVPPNQDFNRRYDLIFSGCSETQGKYLKIDGVENSYWKNIWGFKVAKFLGIDALNMGMGGYSMWQIIYYLLNQFEKFGNPKIILCLFPDLNRITLPNDHKNLVTKYGKNQYLMEEVSAQLEKNQPVFSRKPHKKEEVIPASTSVWINLQALLFMEKYCSSNNIAFKYSTWSEQTDAILLSIINAEKASGLSLSYPGYIHTDPHGWAIESYKTKDCHKKLEKLFPNVFHSGSDGKHMGAHRHEHIAKIFIDNLTKN